VLLLLLLAAESGADIQTVILQGGVAGGVLLLVLFGLLWPRWAVTGILDRVKTTEAQRDALLAQITNEVIPILTEINQRVIPVITRLAERDEKLDRAAEQLKAAGLAMDRLTEEVRRSMGSGR
jgi:hypothetical protein